MPVTTPKPRRPKSTKDQAPRTKDAPPGLSSAQRLKIRELAATFRAATAKRQTKAQQNREARAIRELLIAFGTPPVILAQIQALITLSPER